MQMDVWWWLLIVLARAACDSAPWNVVVTLNTLRSIMQTSDKFLGISTSPRQLLSDGHYSAATVNLLQSLAPGYLRVDGPELDHLAFKTNTNTSGGFLLTEGQWVNLNQLARDTGMHLVFTLSPESRVIEQLLSFSDKQGYDTTWQLGYGNNNSTHNVSSTKLGQAVSILRLLMDSYPGPQNLAILGPDLELCENSECLGALRDSLQQINDATDIIIFQMKPQDNLKNFKSMFAKLDQLSDEIEKTSFNRDTVFPRDKNSLKKHSWVAEPGADHFGGMRDAMSCAFSLGHTSLHGYHTFLLYLPQISQPSPSYWTALLYKALVGQRVLGTRVWPQEDEVVVFAACTAAKPHTSVDTEWEYEPGAVTVWGVNSAERSAQLSLRVGPWLDYVHLYMLTQDEQDKDNILLNGQPLHLVHGVLPRLLPRIRMISRSMSVTVPAQSIFFIILPDAQAPACLAKPIDKLFNLLKKEKGSPMVINMAIPTSRPLPLSRKLGMKSSDVLLEKGGIFRDAAASNKTNGMTTSLKAAAKEVHEGIIAVINDEENTRMEMNQSEKPMSKGNDNFFQFSNSTNSNIAQSFPAFNNENSTLKVFSTNSLENTRKEDLLPTNKHIKTEKLFNENSNEYNPLLQTLIQRDSSSSDSSFSNNYHPKKNQTDKTEVERVKRSENYNYFENPRPRNTETSPLYRRVNLLKRILNKMKESTLYEDAELDQRFQDLTGTTVKTETEIQANKFKISDKYNDHPVEVSLRRKQYMSKEQIPRVETNKETENINYLPGEFYEILGGLKLDSNVSLKDKDKALEVANSFKKQAESREQDDVESNLTVTKKPENDPQEDKRLVEQATENSKQYYVLKNLSVEQNMKTDRSKDSREEKVNYEDNSPQTTSKELKIEKAKHTKLNVGNFFQNSNKVKSDSKLMEIDLAGGRNKRETHYSEDKANSDDPQTYVSQDQYYYNKSDYSDEVELRRFLEELTSEGEQLLQTIDEEYERSIVNSSSETGKRQFLITDPTPIWNKNETLFGDEKFVLDKNKEAEPDFYIKNNIIVDKVKPKRKYLSVDEQSMESSTANTPTVNNKEMLSQFNTTVSPDFGSSRFETDFPPSSEPSVLIEPTALRESINTYIRTNSTSGSITDAVKIPDILIESLIPQTNKTTEPGINFIINTNLESNVSNTSPYNVAENSNSDYITDNSDKVSEINRKDAELSKSEVKFSLTSKETNQQQKMPNIKGESIFFKKISELITTTEKSLNSDIHIYVKNKTISNMVAIPPIPSDIYNETTELRKGAEFNNYTNAQPDQQHIKPEPIIKPILTQNISDSFTAATKNNSDKKRLVSESKNVNKVLPPSLKPTTLLHKRLFSVPLDLNVNHTMTLPTKIDVLNNRIMEFNNKHKLTVPALERSSSLNATFSDKYKERLEVIKQRLQKARERLLNLSKPGVTPSVTFNKSLKVKRDITQNNEVLNSLSNGKNEKEAETKSDKNKFSSETLLRDFDLYHRFSRQVYNDDESGGSLSTEKELLHSKSEESKSFTGRPSSSNIVTPYYFSAIKKWVIPLGNTTENILYNNKLLPVNLYGIVSEKWVQENNRDDTKRQRRDLHYPCLKDKFNDFETDKENSKFPWSYIVQNGKTPSTRSTKDTPNHSWTGPRNANHDTILPQRYSSRLRRTTNQDIERNEMEMKALLTNEIVKEKPTNNDVSDDENVFSSLLHKTLSKTVTNKTGIERLFELAKQYKKTNPSSLEIFSTKNKQYEDQSFPKESLDESEEENTAIEVTDGKNIFESSTTLMGDQIVASSTISKGNSEKEVVVKNSTDEEIPSVGYDQITDPSQEENKTQKDTWSQFIDKIEEMFQSITSY